MARRATPVERRVGDLQIVRGVQREAGRIIEAAATIWVGLLNASYTARGTRIWQAGYVVKSENGAVARIGYPQGLHVQVVNHQPVVIHHRLAPAARPNLDNFFAERHARADVQRQGDRRGRAGCDFGLGKQTRNPRWQFAEAQLDRAVVTVHCSDVQGDGAAVALRNINHAWREGNAEVWCDRVVVVGTAFVGAGAGARFWKTVEFGKASVRIGRNLPLRFGLYVRQTAEVGPFR